MIRNKRDNKKYKEGNEVIGTKKERETEGKAVMTIANENRSQLNKREKIVLC